MIAKKSCELQTVLFKSGKIGRYVVFVYAGACLKGDPTRYIIRDGEMTWVKPGESVTWIEA